MKLTIAGHCYSKKNSRPIFRTGSGRPFLGKSSQLRRYERGANILLRSAWGPRPPLQGRIEVKLTFYYAGREPDALGPAETVFDALQAAGIVTDDVQLVPSGLPAIARVHVGRAEERVEIELCLTGQEFATVARKG